MLIYSHCLIGISCHTEEYTFRLYDFNSVVMICIRRKSYRAKERPEPDFCDLFTSICLLETHIRKKPFLNSLKSCDIFPFTNKIWVKPFLLISGLLLSVCKTKMSNLESMLDMFSPARYLFADRTEPKK